jgi:DNA mismatch repair protein MutS
VEMAETAVILAQGSPSSLVLLDENGRRTSFPDGIAIAWAVVEPWL